MDEPADDTAQDAPQAADDAPRAAPPWERWLLGALFTLYALVMCHGIQEDFVAGHLGWGAAMRSTIGRNYDELGFVDTGLQPIKNWERVEDMSTARAHWHHPPLVNILVGASFRVFGVSNASTRGVTVAFALALFWLVYLYTRRRYGPQEACAAVFVLTLLPMHMEYGNIVNYEPLVLVFGAMAVRILERMREGDRGEDRARQRGLLALLCLTVMAAGFSSWSGYILAFALGVDALARSPRRVDVFVAVGAASALFMAWCVWWLTSTTDPDRLVALGQARAGRTSLLWLSARTLDRAFIYYMPGPLLVAAGWIVARARSHREVDPMVAVFGLTTLIYALVFRQGTWIHNFYISHVTPAVAVAAGVGAVAMSRHAATPRARRLALGFLAALMALTVWRQARTTHERSYRIRPHEYPSRGFPRDGAVDEVALGRWLEGHVAPGQRVLMKGRNELSMGARFYAGRDVVNTRRPPRDPGPDDAVYVTHDDWSSEANIARLARRYPVTRFEGFAVYDLRRPGEREVSVYRLEAKPMTLWHWYTTSALYPPYEVVEDPERARELMKEWELARPARAATRRERKRAAGTRRVAPTPPAKKGRAGEGPEAFTLPATRPPRRGAPAGQPGPARETPPRP
jgi:4-amino-4-deoxy-L-arabinose transferase-like glycosyltransferase